MRMKNKAKKKLMQSILSLTLIVALVVSSNLVSFSGELGTDSTTVSENDVADSEAEQEEAQDSENEQEITAFGIVSDEEGNVLSIQERKDINPDGDMTHTWLAEKQRAEHPDYITVKTYDSNSWSFQQSFARGELFNTLNAARMNSANWWYYTNNLGDPLTKQYVTVKKNYVWDYELERCAMQRCVELAFCYSHVRPDLVNAQEVFMDLDSPYKDAKNCNELAGCYGNTATTIVAAFMEENELCYAGQTHRVAILEDSYYRIGISCIKTKSGTYLTEILIAQDQYYAGGTIPLGEWTAPVDTAMEMEVKLAADTTIGKCTDVSRYGQGQVYLTVGDTYNINDIDFGPYEVAIFKGNDEHFNWYSTDTSVVTIHNGIVTAVGAGDANIESLGSYGIDGGKAFTVTAPPTSGGGSSNTPDPGNGGTSSGGGNSGNGNTAVTEIPQSIPTPQPQVITVSKKASKTVTFKKSKLEKKSQSFNIGAVVNNGGAHGKVSYKVSKYPKGGKKYIKVSSKGKVTLKKGAKKGTYKITVTAAGTEYFAEAKKTITIKVK